MSVFVSGDMSEKMLHDCSSLDGVKAMNEFVTVFRRWSDFGGRSSRREFWMYGLVLLLLSVLLGILDVVLLGQEAVLYRVWTLGNVFALVTLVPSLSVSVRRLHDIDKSGWWLLIMPTGIGLFLIIYWNCLASDAGENTYGALSTVDEAIPPDEN